MNSRPTPLLEQKQTITRLELWGMLDSLLCRGRGSQAKVQANPHLHIMCAMRSCSWIFKSVVLYMRVCLLVASTSGPHIPQSARCPALNRIRNHARNVIIIIITIIMIHEMQCKANPGTRYWYVSWHNQARNQICMLSMLQPAFRPVYGSILTLASPELLYRNHSSTLGSTEHRSASRTGVIPYWAICQWVSAMLSPVVSIGCQAKQFFSSGERDPLRKRGRALFLQIFCGQRDSNYQRFCFEGVCLGRF